MKKILLTTLTCFNMCAFAQSDYNNLIEEGLQLLKQKNIEAAIQKYQLAYEIDSTRVEANYGLGTAYQYLCQKNNSSCFTALSFLNTVIEIDDTYRNCYYNRGSVKNSIGDYKSAVEDFTKAITKNPNKAHYYINRSLAYQKIGNYQQECADLKRAVELGSFDAKNILATKSCN